MYFFLTVSKPDGSRKGKQSDLEGFPANMQLFLELHSSTFLLVFPVYQLVSSVLSVQLLT